MYFAYLIMGHENSLVLRELVKNLDDYRNDIFIHFDAKIEFSFQEELSRLASKSKIYFLQKRIKVYWATISQVEAEYLLFEEAFKMRKYSYYHLLSGSDLPIAKQNIIHNFFEDYNGFEFIGFSKNILPERIQYIHLFPKKFRSSNPIYFYLRTVFILVQKFFKYDHFKKFSQWEIKKGTNWVSVTNNFVGFMLSQKNFILSLLKYSKSPDEHYKQILAFNFEFKDKIFFIDDEYRSCMRCIDWKRGGPYIWCNNDFSEIFNSNKLFARKFNEKEVELIHQVIKFISEKT